MATKKLYSFRAEERLLNALRKRADEEETTVSELIHRLLSKALGLDEAGHAAISHEEVKSLMAEFKEEVIEQVKKEIEQLPH